MITHALGKTKPEVDPGPKGGARAGGGKSAYSSGKD